MILMALKDVSKSFGIDVILRNISFNVREGDKIGLIGANGSGKTTLLRIMSEELQRDDGEIYKRKDLRIGYLTQDSNLNEHNAIRDELLKAFGHLISIEKELESLEQAMQDQSKLKLTLEKYEALSRKYEELGGYTYKSRVQGIILGLGFADVADQLPIAKLSGGQKTRVALAKILLSDFDLLLLDEPTNYLDIKSVEWLEGYIKDYVKSLVIISHDRYFLDRVVGQIFEVENHEVTCYNGNYSEFARRKRENLEVAIKAYTNQQKEIKRQKELIARLTSFGSEKKVKRARSRQKLLDKMEVHDRPSTETKKSKIVFTPSIKSGNEVFFAEELALSYPDNPLFERANIEIYKGERVGLIGPNGVGKTTFFKCIMGKHEIDKGSIRLGHNVQIGYYDQELKGIDPENTVIEEIWDQSPDMTHQEVRDSLAAILFSGDDVWKEVGNLSGGERGRLSLLKLMKSEANFLLLDEPTNHLDMFSKQVLEEALTSYEGTMLIISHDRYFLNQVCTKLVELSPLGTKTYLGNYDYMLEKKEYLQDDDEEIKPTKTSIKEQRKKEKEKEDLLRAHKRSIKDIEESIAKLELEIKSLNEELCQEEIYSDQERARATNQSLKEKEALLEGLIAKWEELLDSAPDTNNS